MRRGPHQMYMGWPVLSSSRTAVRKPGGQPEGAPSPLADQSWARINAPKLAAARVLRKCLSVAVIALRQSPAVS